uniref:Uncharacterized protein n=1 Tax=Anopheles stephensi TaxID=30069 RepID=A0A182YM02_ANOST
MTRVLKSVDGKCNEPVVSKTRLGWIVYGPCAVARVGPGADDGTKWAKTPDLSAQGRWFSGPPFLWGPENAWPARVDPEKDTSEELRKSVHHHQVTEPLIVLDRFSKWKRVLQYPSSRHATVIGPLTQDELAEAERVIIRGIQRRAYNSEIVSLRKQTPQKHPWKRGVEKKSSIYKLSPILDNHGILREGESLTECVGINESSRNPIILPRRDYGTDFIIREQHERYKHGNHNTVLSELRMRYHIPKLLGEYRRVRRDCQWCKVNNARPEPPLMGNLPQQRTAFDQRAFSFTGIDYFGSFLVAVGRREEKRWGVIFTCLTSRAVHLEKAASLTTASCILAFRRFIARRGKPLEVISDRGINFIGASRELKKALEEVDHDVLMTEFYGPRMKWTFKRVKCGAPHFDGCWERLVRSVKKVLNQFVFPKRPTDEVMLSTFTEIELILNSRPLTYVPLNDELADPITPNHLLLGSSDGSKPPAVFCDSPATIR